MDITYINSRNIKICISKEELMNSGIDAQSMDYADRKTKKLIWDILDRAYEEIGFDIGKDGVLVRVFPATDGSCELFISKKQKNENNTTPSECSGYICILDDSESLFLLCKRLKEAGFVGYSSLYSENDSFLLRYSYKRKLPSYVGKNVIKEPEKKFIFAGEYGHVIPDNPITNAYLCEHCCMLCNENAIEKLAFQNI